MSAIVLRPFDYFRLFGLFLLCLAMILFNGAVGKPIWIDEFLHFALGSHSSTAEAWDTIRRTTVNINHGQTGVYMLLDYWLLKIFGANLLALRAPSIVSTIWLLISGFAILWARGFRWVWMYFLVICLMGQLTLMSYVAEARPYMPLVAASSGALAYYLEPLESRQQTWMRWFGAISILWGVLMHPYFSVYWAVLWAFAYWHHCYSGNFKIGIRSLLLHLNVPLLISGTALFFLLGAATWLRPGPEFSLDPFQWIANDGYWKTFFDISQFQFLRPGGDVLTILVLASLLAFTFLNSRIKSYLKPAIAPLVLIIVMLAVTLLLTYLSMYRDYWILPRQWVASIGLVAIGFVWMVAEVSRVLSIRYKKIAAVACFSLFAYVVYLLMPSSVATYKNLEHVLFFKDDAASYTPDYLSGHAVPTSNDEWVALAKANIEMGGAVWPVFREFYGLEE